MSADAVADACTTLADWIRQVTEPDTERDRADAGLVRRTGGLISIHDEQPRTRSRPQPRSSPPWNPAVAAALYDAWTGIRHLETWLHERVTERPQLMKRSGSDQATFAALLRITELARQAQREETAYALSKLNKWISGIRQLPAIDDAPRWERIRPGPDGMPPRCPYCRTFSLRVSMTRGFVMCWFPGCHDSDGKRPQARMDISRLTSGPVLAWQDGLVQSP